MVQVEATRVPDPLIGPMGVADWSGWEQLIADRGIVIERGHIPGTSAADGEEVDVFVGTMRTGLVGLIALTHQPSEVIEPKLMMNLSRVDANGILAFLDRCDPPPGLDLVWRRAAERGKPRFEWPRSGSGACDARRSCFGGR